MGDKGKAKKPKQVKIEPSAANDQLGENAGEGRMIKSHEDRKRK